MRMVLTVWVPGIALRSPSSPTYVYFFPSELSSCWPCTGLWKQAKGQDHRAKAEQGRSAFRIWQVDIILEQCLVCLPL